MSNQSSTLSKASLITNDNIDDINTTKKNSKKSGVAALFFAITGSVFSFFYFFFLKTLNNVYLHRLDNIEKSPTLHYILILCFFSLFALLSVIAIVLAIISFKKGNKNGITITSLFLSITNLVVLAFTTSSVPIYTKDIVRFIFSEENSNLAIGLFDIWHFMYLAVAFALPIIIAVALKNKSEKAKLKAVTFFAYLTIGFYIADFFIMPLSDSYNGISQDKLPFHICTLMGTLVPFVQFNERFKPIKNLIVSLAITSSVMWMVYPGSALGGEPPFSYRIFQTFMFHGFLYGWGFLNLAFDFEKLNFKNFWKEFCAVLSMIVFATFGNAVYDNQNWLFIDSSIFPFLNDEVMPFVVLFCITGSCFVVYCVYYMVCAIIKNKRIKKTF